MLNIKEYIDLIYDYNYALTKIDVPYNPTTFPFEYAIGKDLDMFVSEDCFEKIQETTLNFFKQYTCFQFRIIKNAKNFRLRMEQNGVLHYQIDITMNDQMIQNKEYRNHYYILSLNNEMKVRLNEIRQNPGKLHHRDWIISHQTGNSEGKL